MIGTNYIIKKFYIVLYIYTVNTGPSLLCSLTLVPRETSKSSVSNPAIRLASCSDDPKHSAKKWNIPIWKFNAISVLNPFQPFPPHWSVHFKSIVGLYREKLHHGPNNCRPNFIWSPAEGFAMNTTHNYQCILFVIGFLSLLACLIGHLICLMNPCDVGCEVLGM